MPIIFKNIRRKLAAQNKTMAYMRYAIGEIFLVVIGILIALQVNNWNEGRKDRKLEHGYLLRLHEDMLVSLKNVKGNIKDIKEQIDLQNQMIDWLEKGVLKKEDYGTFSYGLYEFGKIPPPSLVTGTLDELRSTGRITVIQNDSLRKALQNMEDKAENIREIMTYIVARISPQISYIDSRVVMLKVSDKKQPPHISRESAAGLYDFDFPALSKNPRVISAISAMNQICRVLYSQNEELKNMYKRIISLLEKQLNHDKN
jgi:hypothetical protein